MFSTHKGPFCYFRLPYRVSSAPEIFQQVIENLLQNVLGVVVYLDDVPITAFDDDSYMAVLEGSIAQDETGRSLPESKQVPIYGKFCGVFGVQD